MTLQQQTRIQLPVKQQRLQNKTLPQIIIIEDDLVLLDELKDFLSFNYEVETVYNSTHAFDIVRELKPDLIIMDMKMFPKTGFQLAYEFKNCPETKSIPIIAITGIFIESEHMVMMKLSGLKRIVIKPFILNLLLGEIDAALRESRPPWA